MLTRRFLLERIVRSLLNYKRRWSIIKTRSLFLNDLDLETVKIFDVGILDQYSSARSILYLHTYLFFDETITIDRDHTNWVLH